MYRSFEVPGMNTIGAFQASLDPGLPLRNQWDVRVQAIGPPRRDTPSSDSGTALIIGFWNNFVTEPDIQEPLVKYPARDLNEWTDLRYLATKADQQTSS
jgi:hypothetical protein